MCDFHSIIVTGDGRILHNASNSHSNIADAHELETGLDAKWWECEWDGIGDIPLALVQTRGKSTEPTALAYRAAERHYEKLAAILRGDLDVMETAPFSLPEYSDVQERAKQAPLRAMLASMDNADIRDLLDDLGIECHRLYNDELESAYERGMEAGGEDLQDEISRAVEQAQKEWNVERDELDEDTLAEKYDEGYKHGYLDAKNGTGALPFIDGMPSFLF